MQSSRTMTKKKYDLEPNLTNGGKADRVYQTDIPPEVAFSDDNVLKSNGENGEFHKKRNIVDPSDIDKSQEESDDERKKSPGLFGFLRKADRQEMVGTFELVCRLWFFFFSFKIQIYNKKPRFQFSVIYADRMHYKINNKNNKKKKICSIFLEQTFFVLYLY